MSNNSLKGWASLVEGEKPDIDYKSFMDEYRQLTAKVKEFHKTADFKEREGLSEKYGISRADMMKFARLDSMMNRSSGEDSVIVGRVSADKVDALIQGGHFAEAVSLIKDGLDTNALKEAQGHHAHVADLAKSNFKSSDLLLSCYFGLSRDGDDYIVRCDSSRMRKDLDDPSVAPNFSRDLKKMENIGKSADEAQMRVESLYNQFDGEAADTTVSQSAQMRR